MHADMAPLPCDCALVASGTPCDYMALYLRDLPYNFSNLAPSDISSKAKEYGKSNDTIKSWVSNFTYL